MFRPIRLKMVMFRPTRLKLAMFRPTGPKLAMFRQKEKFVRLCSIEVNYVLTDWTQVGYVSTDSTERECVRRKPAMFGTTRPNWGCFGRNIGNLVESVETGGLGRTHFCSLESVATLPL